jgi:hypothetical protein
MKALCLFFSLILAVVAMPQRQESSQTQAVRFDVNRNPIPAGSFAETKVKSGDAESSTSVEYGLDSNGQKIPLQSVEESKRQVNGKTLVTRVVHRFDQNGAPASTERSVSEEEKSGTSATKRTSLYRADVNGNEILDEQSVSRVNGGSASTDVLRRATDGTLALAERQTTVTEEIPGGGSKSQIVTYHRDSNGDLYLAAQEVKESVKKGNETVETSAQYVRGGQGTLELAGQKVSRVVAQPDGTVSKQVDIYGAAVPGLSASGSQPVLKERQSVEMRKDPSGALVETTVSRKATVVGGELSAPQVVSETVTNKKQSQQQ